MEKVYKTSNWRDIVEVDVLGSGVDYVVLPPKNPDSKYEFERRERKLKRFSDHSNTKYWNTKEEAIKYLSDRLNSEIEKFESKILKAKTILIKINS